MATISAGLKSFKLLRPTAVVDELVSIIDTRLPLFTSSNSFDKILVTRKNETQHSIAFILFMMKEQDQFTFINETGQKGNFTIDIGVYERATDELIFTIEAKVLPTPKGTKNSPRSESEYVHSEQGYRGAGIQRFKLGKHGVGTNMEPLPSSGMIAYIKENDFDSWLLKINGWINSATWNSSEELQKIYSDEIAKLKSQHLRVDGSQVTLYHFWVKVI